MTLGHPDKKRIMIFIQQSDGITAAVCREFEVSGIGRDRETACKEIFDNILTNSKIVLKKLSLAEPLIAPQEQLLKNRAAEFIKNQANISSYFEFNNL